MRRVSINCKNSRKSPAFNSLFEMRNSRNRERNIDKRVLQLSILYLRCDTHAREGVRRTRPALSILYLRCGRSAYGFPLAASTAFNSLFEMPGDAGDG